MVSGTKKQQEDKKLILNGPLQDSILTRKKLI